MAIEWNYSGDPSESTADATRFLIGDVDETCPLFSDGEIAWALTEQNDVPLNAAIFLAETAATARFARKVSFRIGDVSKNASDIVKQFRELAASLKRRAALNALPFFGGLTVSGKEELDGRSDDVQPSFRRQQDEHPQAIEPQAFPKGTLLGNT